MNIIPVLICLGLISLVQATEQIKMLKPKLLKYVQSQSLEKTKYKLPEERRKLSIFPKSNKKFVVSPEPYYKPIIHKPIATKKPLMRKIILQHQKPSLNVAVEDETRRPIMDTPLLDHNELSVQAEPEVIREEISIEVIEAKSDEPNANQINDKELKTTVTHNANIDYFNVKDFMFPLVKPARVSYENEKDETFSDITDVIRNSEENEVSDLEEFIFLEPVQNLTDSEKVSGEVPEEYFTTETSNNFEKIKPNIFRRKRGSNIIVEENLATTVAGYRYTGKDTRLNNDVVFKNINS